MGTDGSTAARPPSSRIWTVPNIISFVRLATVPVFVVLFVTGRENAAVILYALGAWSDFLDGYIARRTNSVTDLGKLLDPLADKLLEHGVYVIGFSFPAGLVLYWTVSNLFMIGQQTLLLRAGHIGPDALERRPPYGRSLLRRDARLYRLVTRA